MLRFIIGAAIILHGLVHALYFGQSWRLFELQSGLGWPDGSWAFSRLLGNAATRSLAGALCVLAALGFAAGGIGLLARLAWWRPLVVASAALSTALFVLFWDGELQKLDAKGGVGLLISLAILVAVVIFRWPGSRL